MPLLMDGNIHYRLLKLVYTLSYATFHVAMFLKKNTRRKLG